MTARELQELEPEEVEAPEEEAEAEAGGQESGPRKLREALDRHKERADKALASAQRLALANLGLQPDKGMGKAIVTAYEGDWTSDTVLEDLRTFAQAEFEFEATSPSAPVTEEEQKRREANGRTEQLRNSATPDEPSPEGQARLEALAAKAGEFSQVGDIGKAQELHDQLFGLAAERIVEIQRQRDGVGTEGWGT